MSGVGTSEHALDCAQKMLLIKEVPIFRHLSEQLTSDLVKSLTPHRYQKGSLVFKQGDMGSSFFVIASGELTVFINDKQIQTLTKNAYLGERALLFDEPRTSTVKVSSNEAELWSIEKQAFKSIIKGKMQEDLVHRIGQQDTTSG